MRKIPTSTNPCIIFVLPVASDTVIIKRESPRSTVDFMSIPKVMRNPVKTDINAMVGILSPILASADPKARLSEVWISLFSAALKAANPSGSSTTPAIIIPTKDLGAPTETTRYSISLDRNFAAKTTIPKHRISITQLISICTFEGLTSAFLHFGLLKAYSLVK
jgi:hypothetical protein